MGPHHFIFRATHNVFFFIALKLAVQGYFQLWLNQVSITVVWDRSSEWAGSIVHWPGIMRPRRLALVCM